MEVPILELTSVNWTWIFPWLTWSETTTTATTTDPDFGKSNRWLPWKNKHLVHFGLSCDQLEAYFVVRLLQSYGASRLTHLKFSNQATWHGGWMCVTGQAAWSSMVIKGFCVLFIVKYWLVWNIVKHSSPSWRWWLIHFGVDVWEFVFFFSWKS